MVAILQATIDTLQGQLSVKDKQIEELNARLAEVSSALVVDAQAAQALHAGSTDGEDDPNQQGRRWSRKKAGFQKFLVADRKQKVYFFSSVQVRKAV